MTFPVVFRGAARHEFQEAARWYEARHAGLGLQYVAEVDRAVHRGRSPPEAALDDALLDLEYGA
jgi:hypothetical protein